MYCKLLLTTALFFFYSTQTVLAISTSLTSPPTEVIKGQEFLLNASISASASKEYYLKARIGASSSTLTKGTTKNESNTSPDDWLTDSDSWSKFPKVTTDSVGNWSGTLKAKTTDSVILGSNSLVLRIRQVDNSTNYDSTAYPINVSNIPSSSPSPSVSPESSKEVSINSAPSNVSGGDTFVITGNLNSSSKKTLGLKILIGTTQSTKDMKSGSTLSSDSSWLSWNDAWSKFPQIVTNDSGLASFSLSGKANSNTPTGTAYLVVRAHDIDKDINYDSEPKSFNLNQPASSPDPSPSTSSIPQASSSLISGSNKTANTPSPPSSTKTSSSKAPSIKEVKPVGSVPNLLSDIKLASVASVLGEKIASPASLLDSSLPIPKIKGWDNSSLILIGTGILTLVIGISAAFREKLISLFRSRRKG